MAWSKWTVPVMALNPGETIALSVRTARHGEREFIAYPRPANAPATIGWE